MDIKSNEMKTDIKGLRGVRGWFLLAILGLTIWLTAMLGIMEYGYFLSEIISYIAVMVSILSAVELAIQLKADSCEFRVFRIFEQMKTDTLIMLECIVILADLGLISWIDTIYYHWLWTYGGWGILALIATAVIFFMLLPEAFVAVICYVVFVRRMKDSEKRKIFWIAAARSKRKEEKAKKKKEGRIRRAFRCCRERIIQWQANYEKSHEFEQKQLIRTFVFVVINIAAILLILFSYPVTPVIRIIIAVMLGICIVFYLRQKNFYHDTGMVIGELHHLAEGEVVLPVATAETSPLYEAACDLERINDSLDLSVKRQMRSEQMKVDLITNVSHDLKTPLTSIIGYIDLLKKEEMSPEAKDYVEVLSTKSEHLKDMIQDLFEISKASSGNAELVLEKLDMNKLIEQTLGDMEDKIKSSGRTIRTKLPETPLFISGDGKKLYRVYQNLLDNALKYSLEGTRIYVEAALDDNHVITTVKNISSYEMDFTADKIVERFQRGDDSRTTEGHGLGLAIAKSFSEACGGQLEIVIDGDMFKTNIKYPVYREA